MIPVLMAISCTSRKKRDKHSDAHELNKRRRLLHSVSYLDLSVKRTPLVKPQKCHPLKLPEESVSLPASFYAHLKKTITAATGSSRRTAHPSLAKQNQHSNSKLQHRHLLTMKKRRNTRTVPLLLSVLGKRGPEFLSLC